MQIMNIYKGNPLISRYKLILNMQPEKEIPISTLDDVVNEMQIWWIYEPWNGIAVFHIRI